MAENKSGFNLAAALGAVPNLDTGKEQIEYIDIDRIKSDDKNFYELSALDALIENIELVGLMDPIRVRPDGDEYIIVSGHRRTAALRKLCESDDKWRSVPAIVEDGNSSPAMQELRLIYANSATREMSSADKAKQVERVTELLYQLKEEGVEFPGRMRDHVAEACNISKSKLARLKVIKDNLSAQMKKLWDCGKLNESAAYRIAQEPKAYQNVLIGAVGEGRVAKFYEWELDNRFRDIHRIYERKCKSGTTCNHTDTMIESAMSPGYSYCANYCCLNCPELVKCKHICKSAEKKQAKLKTDAKTARAQAKAAAEEKDSRDVADIKNLWNRFGIARNMAGVESEDFMKARGFWFNDTTASEREKKESLEYKFTASTDLPFCSYELSLGGVRALTDTAKLLSVSIDYLLGLTPDPAHPQVSAATTDEPTFRTGEPPKKGTYYCKFDCSGVILHQVAVWNSLCKWWAFKKGAKIDAKCLGWYALPEDKENA